MSSVPSHAEVVIIGGGIVGCSIAYHLAQRGMAPLLLERKRLASGSTWQSAAVVTQLRPTLNLTRLSQYSARLYDTLKHEAGQETGFKRIGALSIACSEARRFEQRRLMAMAQLFGLPGEVLSAEQVHAHYPMLNMDGITGGVFLPTDGITDPMATTQALASAAMASGAKIFENVQVTNILRERGRAMGVLTDRGEIWANTVVLAAGMWSRDFAAAEDVSVPLLPAQISYVELDQVAGLPETLPVLRNPDENFFLYPQTGKRRYLVGTFLKTAKTWGVNGIPADYSFQHLPDDLSAMQAAVDAAAARIPLLRGAAVQARFTAPEAFTPDGSYLLGPAPELPGLFIASGFSQLGIHSACGAGKVVADWIIDGHPGMDLADVDIRRFTRFQHNKAYLAARVPEMPGLIYGMHWPFRQPTTARGARRSILHDRLAARGACFGETIGWERANWFALPGQTPDYEYSYGRQNWFAASAREHHAVRNNVGLFDLSSLSKFQVLGRDALRLLSVMSTSDLDVELGRITDTFWLNAQGGIECAVSITRLGEHSFQVAASAADQARALNFLHDTNTAYHCGAVDVTSAYATLGLKGPRSRELLAQLTPDDVSNEGFRHGDSREIEIGFARVRAVRVSYVGELAWELHIPTEFAPDVFDRIMQAGEAFGLQLCGFHAFHSLRLEKSIYHWGQDVSSDVTPLEAGMQHLVSYDKPGGFVGREALLRQQSEGISRHMVQFLVSDPEAMLYRDEPVWNDGMRVGRVTSGMYGHTLGGAVGLAIVRGRTIGGNGYEIEIGGRRIAARASLVPMYDPDNTRLMQ